uniref:Uncharacterized protein n=1 Tax=Avena sativa TaxID=4498 RepID=A0ACD5UQ51_AVESA
MEAAAACLPEDVVLEILVRVADAAFLFRCAMACKRWLRLVVDPSFLRRCWPEDACDPSSLLGCFTTQHQYRRHDCQFCSKPVFLPVPRQSTTLGSFVPSAAGLLDRAVPLVARRGLILVRVAGAHADLATRYQYCDLVLNLAVYNLFAGTCDVLPPLRCDSLSARDDTKGYAILTGAELQSDLSFFKVLIIGLDKSESRHNLHTFSSSRSGWSTPTHCFCPRERPRILLDTILHRDAVVCRDTTHWIFSDSSNNYTLGVDVVTDHVTSLSKLPIPPELMQPSHIPYSTPMLCAMAGGTLSSCSLYTGGSLLEIWTRQDDADAWLRTRVIHLQLPKHIADGHGGGLAICWAEKSRTLLALHSPETLYIADAETGAMEEVPTQLHGDDARTASLLRDAMAIEMDWPALFLSRLGNLSF